MYKTKYFKLWELLPKEIYKNEEEGWDLIDERLLKTADAIREIIGKPLICNTWYTGGKRGYSCARIPACKEYSKGSYHSVRDDRKVMAIDVISTEISAEEMRSKIKENEASLPYPIRIEKGVTWLHVDVAAKEGYKIYEFTA